MMPVDRELQEADELSFLQRQNDRELLRYTHNRQVAVSKVASSAY